MYVPNLLTAPDLWGKSPSEPGGDRLGKAGAAAFIQGTVVFIIVGVN